MLGLAEAAQACKDDKSMPDWWSRSPSKWREVKGEIADSEVPFMTYRLWLIWTDLQLYREWPDMDYADSVQPAPADIEKIPQMACYEIAVRVLDGW